MLGHSAISETALSEAIAGSTSITGTLATTNAADTLSASGGVLVSGTLATTNAADTLSASGGVLVSGTLAYTNTNDTVSASGTSGSITGTVDVINADDTVSASGSSGSDIRGHIHRRYTARAWYFVKGEYRYLLPEELAELLVEKEIPPTKVRAVKSAGIQFTPPETPDISKLAPLAKKLQDEIKQHMDWIQDEQDIQDLIRLLH